MPINSVLTGELDPWGGGAQGPVSGWSGCAWACLPPARHNSWDGALVGSSTRQQIVIHESAVAFSLLGRLFLRGPPSSCSWRRPAKQMVMTSRFYGNLILGALLYVDSCWLFRISEVQSCWSFFVFGRPDLQPNNGSFLRLDDPAQSVYCLAPALLPRVFKHSLIGIF